MIFKYIYKDNLVDLENEVEICEGDKIEWCDKVYKIIFRSAAKEKLIHEKKQAFIKLYGGVKFIVTADHLKDDYFKNTIACEAILVETAK